MGKFGKKNEIDLNPLSYNILLGGLGGIGKTTISKEICEKLVGEEGYIHFNIGRESGVDSINGIISEDIEDWEKLDEVTTDIIENKTSDYPDLKVVVWDSLDELILLGEKETIRRYNKTRKPDEKIDSINSAMGGFGKGLDYNINMILDIMWELKKVGVQSFIISHTRRADIIDPISQATYSQLTADAQQRYFNAIKNKMDIVAMAYIDRDIVTENTGRKNAVTKKDVTINKVSGERRVIVFRDDNYAVDSKSRFADIVDKIPFDSDEFIKAIQDAIDAEQKKGGITNSQAKKKQAEKDKIAAEKAAEYSKSAKENKVDLDRNEELKSLIQESLPNLDKDKKSEFKALMAELEITDFKHVDEIPTKKMEQLAEFLG